MLRTADSFADDVIDDAALCGIAPSLPAGKAPEPAPLAPGGRYGDRRRISLPAIVLTIAIHVALLGGLLHLQFRAEDKKVVKLISVDLTPEAPPPAPSPQEVPDTARVPIAAPKPLIEVPRPIPPIAVTPGPRPVPIAAPPAPPPAPPAPPSIIKSDDLAAEMLSGQPPRYPTESRRKREQGTVLLSLTLGTDGSVAEISVARSSGFERLDKAARDAVRRWRWVPIKRNGQPVMVRGVVEIPFVLQG